MTRLIRSIVETPGSTDVEYLSVPDEWDDMSEEAQDTYCVEVAVNHQNNVAPCGARVVDVDDAEWARIHRDGLIVE